jgi:hypothetical protein
MLGFDGVSFIAHERNPFHDEWHRSFYRLLESPMAAPTKFRTRFRTPTCRNCGSDNLTATSSQQYRIVGGQRRQAADVVCNDCGNQWWSLSPHVNAMARAEDAKRRAATLHSGNKERAKVAGAGRQVTTKPRAKTAALDLRKNKRT